MAATLKIICLSRLIRRSVGVGLIVALSAACSSPTTPATESALKAKTVDAEGLGAGWAGAGLYTRTTIPIPCITGVCSGPEPPGNAFQNTFLNRITGANFDEYIAWFPNPATVFDAIRRNSPGISKLVGIPVLQAPRIGSAEQLGLAYSSPGSYHLTYFVEEHGYIGYFVYTGPRSGDVVMDVAVKRFS